MKISHEDFSYQGSPYRMVLRVRDGVPECTLLAEMQTDRGSYFSTINTVRGVGMMNLPDSSSKFTTLVDRRQGQTRRAYIQLDGMKVYRAHVNMLVDLLYYKGDPPHIGWWLCAAASGEPCADGPDCVVGQWRWWNGSGWSRAVSPTSLPLRAEELSQIPAYHDLTIFWSDYYPPNARVPRSKP